ncbi:MAG: tetratricopeptide repeat protein, partial [Bacteroidota bacterium]
MVIQLRLFLLILVFSTFQKSVNAQISLDSLARNWGTGTYEEQKKALDYLIKEYAYTNADSARYYLKKLSDVVKSEDKKGKIMVKMLGSNLLYDQANYDSAVVVNNEALQLANSIQDTSYLSRIHLNFGSFYDALGIKDSAIHHYLRSISLFEALKDEVNVAYLKINLGLLFKSLEEYPKAEQYYLEALEELTALKDDFGTTTVSTNLASMYHARGMHVKAVEFAQKGKEGYENLGYAAYAMYPLETLGEANAALGNTEKALAYFSEAIEIAQKNDYKEELFTLRLGLAKVYAQKNNLQVSKIELDKALDLA